jgi:hypothetical protein
MKNLIKKFMRKLIFTYMLLSGDVKIEHTNEYGQYVIRVFTKEYYNELMRIVEDKNG